MHRIAALFLLPALADDRIRLQAPIPLVEDHDIDDQIISHCGIHAGFSPAGP